MRGQSADLKVGATKLREQSENVYENKGAATLSALETHCKDER